LTLAAAAVCAGVLVAAALPVPERSETPMVDAAPLQGGAWVLKAPVVHQEKDHIPVPDENQQGSFSIGPAGASSSFSWSNEHTGRSGSMTTQHAWTPPPAVLQPGQTIEVSVSSTLGISGSGDGWHHNCDTWFWADPPGRRLASANLGGYEYNPGTKTGKFAYTVPSGPGTLQWFFGVSTSWNDGSSVTFDYEWRAVAPPMTATASATATATPTATPTPVFDVMVGHVEHTQVIQCMDFSEGATNCADNEIPLIRGKPALLRVYPLVDLASGKVDGLRLDARVTVLDPPGRVLRPLHGPAVLTAAHTDGSRAITLRPHLGGGTLDFDLPLDLVRRASVVLRVELDPDRRLAETDTRNNTEIVTLDFVPSPELAVTYVPIRYRPPGKPGTLPDADRIARAAAWMKGTFPLAASALTYRRGRSIGFDESLTPKATQRALIARLNWLYAHPRVLNLGGSPDLLVGWLPRTGDTKVVGRSNPAWSAPAGLEHVVWVQDYAHGPETMAHEISHNLGRRHPIRTKPDRVNACGAWDGATDWPFPLDPTIREIGVAPAAAGWKALASGLHDVMSYCDDQGYGLAPWTYRKLYDRLAVAPPPADARAAAADDWAAEPLIVASGTVFRAGSAGLDKILFIDGDPSAIEYGESGEFCVAQLDGDDRTLDDVCFEADFLDSELEPVDAEDFFVVRRAAPGVRALEVRRLGQPLARRAASAHAPAVVITSPAAGDRWDGMRTIRWTASDADGEPIVFDVVYSPDGGVTWTHVDAGLVGNSYALDMAELPGGEGAVVRVYASDGFLTTAATSDAFAVTEKSPRPVILAPARGAVLRPGMPVRLSAGGDDLEDGALPSDAFTWTSDRDGLLGVGDMVVTQLSAGNHWITLGAQDSGGIFGADVISVSVRAYEAHLPVSLRAARLGASDAPPGTPATASATPRRTPTRTSTPGTNPTPTRTRTPTSRPPTPSPTATGGPAPLCRSWLVNPGFESGPVDWWAFAALEPGDAATVVVEGASVGVAARSGEWLAMLGRNPDASDEMLIQPWPPHGPLVEPGRMISATLQMHFGILTDEVRDGVHDDWLASVVYDQSGNPESVPRTMFSEEIIDSDTWYEFAHPVDVTGLLTQRSGWESMAFGWYGENSAEHRSRFVLDNARLIVCQRAAASPPALLPSLSPARTRDVVLPAAVLRTDAAMADPRQLRRLGPILESVLHQERSR